MGGGRRVCVWQARGTESGKPRERGGRAEGGRGAARWWCVGGGG